MDTYNVKALQDKIAALLAEGRLKPEDPVKLYFKCPERGYFKHSFLDVVGGGCGALELYEYLGDEEEEND